MEESKTTSGYVYEDDYSFITEDHELFLKEGTHVEKRKLAEVEKGRMEEKIEELKQAFVDLELQVRKLENQDDPNTEKVEQLKSEVKNAEAIGDFEELYNRLNKLTNGEEKVESSADEAEPEIKSRDLQDNEYGEETTGPKEVSGEEEEKDEKNNGSRAEGEDSSGEPEESAESREEPAEYYTAIVERAKELADQSDWSYVSAELDNLSRKWSEGPEADTDRVKKLFKKFNKAVETFEEHKQKHFEQIEKQKEGNLQKKQELLSKLREIVENEEWLATDKVGSIKGQWRSVGILPKGKDRELDEEFDELLSVFKDHKVDRLVQKRQKEEDNLMLKLSVLDKMEKVVGEIDESTEEWKKIDEVFEDLTNQWKKVGRVPREKSNEVWQRYKNAQDEYYDRKYKYDEKHRKKVEKFRSRKEKLCREAESLKEAEDLAKAARKINKLHHRWKRVGNLPQRDEDELWDRFKSATDAFNERKSENIEKLRAQEEEHYKQKLELIEKAEAIKETDDFEKGHQKMQSLMDKWKAIGPVPRKKSNKIWKKFKGAMDIFYDRRRDYLKEDKEERKENLKEKKELLDKLRELGQHEDPIEAVNIAKKLQAQFKDAGKVPIKKKNRMWKQYREACDVIYDRYRAAKSGSKFDQELAKADLDSEQRSQIQDMRKKHKKIKKEIRKLEEEVLQYQETKTYFKPTNKGSVLRDEIQEKIDKAEERLEDKQEELDSLDRQMEKIKENA